MNISNKVKDSIFEVLPNGDIKVENAVILWPNFSGKPTEMNSAGGKRTFCLMLNEELADRLREEGWNIKDRPPRDPDDYPFIFTEIVVNMDSRFPPEVWLRTEFRGRPSMIQLNEETIGQLDDIQIVGADLVIHPYVHGRGAYKCKGYARYVNVKQAVTNYFGDKYSDYEDPIQ